MKNPTAIFCGDLHFRDTQPVCRTDNFWEAQIRSMRWLKDLQRQYGCPIYCSGDYFHHWKPSPRLLSACIEHMPFVHTIPGNHDLPNHNIDLLEKSGLWTMQAADSVEIWEAPLGKLCDPNLEIDKRVGLIHELIDHPQSNVTAKGVLKKYKEFDAILSGDNHRTFVVKSGQRILVNPGSFTRQTADQADHKPCVFLWCSQTNDVEQVFIPVEDGVISREHMARAEERDDRIEAFVKSLNEDYDISLSFHSNMREYFANNRTDEEVQAMVWESIGEGK